MRQNKKISVIALETGHLSPISVAGGDLILKHLLPHLPQRIKFQVIIPSLASAHWHGQATTLHLLPGNFLDTRPNKLLVFLSYLIRSYQSYLLLNKLTFSILYSSTNILSDILPAFIFKITHPNTYWIARIHHLIPAPNKREGNLFSNIFAYVLQIFVLYAINKADLTLTLNHSLYQKLLNISIPAKKLDILPGGVPFAKIQKVKPHGPSFDSIFVGRLHQTKGIFDLPAIWKKVTASLPHVRLAIVGEGHPSTLTKLQDKIKSYRLENNIFILGYLAENKLYQTIKSSKIFLFTDREAGFGLAPAEAMAAGLPVVGWDIGILGTVFQAGYIKVPGFNHSLFSQKVIEVLNHKSLRLGLSQEAKKEAKKYDWCKISQKLGQILTSV